MMKPSIARSGRLWLLPVLLWILAGCTPTPGGSGCRGKDVSFDISDVSFDADGIFQQDFCAGIQTVEGWWGKTYAGSFHVTASNSIKVSMALIPSWRVWRGRMIFSGVTVRLGRPLILHELTHLYAPNQNLLIPESHPAMRRR